MPPVKRFLTARLLWLSVLVVASVGLATWLYQRQAPRRIFRIGLNHSPPYYNIKPDGTFDGLAIDVIGEAARRRRITLRWIPVQALGADDALATRTVDLWPLVGATPERATKMHLTKPWLQTDYCLLSRKSSEIPSAAAASGLTIAYPAYPMATRMVHQILAQSRLVPKPDNHKVISAVCEGTVNAGFLEARTLDPVLLKRPPGCEGAEFSIHFVNGANAGYSIASTFEAGKTAEELRAEISKLIADGTLAASLDKWAPFSVGETRSLLALHQAERRSEYFLYGFFTAMIGAGLLFWKVREARRLRRVAERANLLEADRSRIFESLASSESLGLLLSGVSELVERQYPELICSVAVREGDLLTLVCRSSLPDRLAQTLAQVEIEEEAVCYGAAAFGKRLAVSTDLLSDPRWQTRRAEVTASGLGSCWALPVFSGPGLVMGGIAVYLRSRCAPTTAQIRLLEGAAQLAGVVMERRYLYEQLQYQAHHDTLTGLPNRSLLIDRLQQALVTAERQKRQLAILCIDLDRFKQINDTLGHGAGDIFLQRVAGVIRKALRASDTLARMGGDEFTVMLSDIESAEAADMVAQRLIEAIRQPIVVEGAELFGSASIGISVYPQDGTTAEDLQRNADSAMYKAKYEGKNRHRAFSWEMSHHANEIVQMERHLREALEKGYFELHYQPQFSTTGELAGTEALVRLRHPLLGLIPPGRFIPCAEESGLITPIGEWVLFEACRQVAEWQSRQLRPVRVAVNVSAVQLSQPGFSTLVASVLKRTGLSPSMLELELTETAVMRNIDESMRQMRKLKAMGVRLAIDDFGTGYSSLSYLQRLPVNTVKIDQSFIREGGTHKHALPLVQAIAAASRSLGLEVVAEGVETSGQYESVCASGCGIIQGFFLSKPLRPADLERVFLESRSQRLQPEMDQLMHQGDAGPSGRGYSLSARLS